MLIKLLILNLVLLIIVIFLPTPIKTIFWQSPQIVPSSADITSSLSAKASFELGESRYSYGVAVDDKGEIYTSISDGRIMRFPRYGGMPELFADTKGLPLGMRFDSNKTLWVADAQRGLLSISPDGKVSVAVNMNKYPLVDVVPDDHCQCVYFTQASSFYTSEDVVLEMIERHPSGKVWRWKYANGTLDLLLQGLFTPSGLELSKDGTFLLINESMAYRTTRLWLSKSSNVKKDIFAGGYYGIPLALHRSENGLFLIGILGHRHGIIDSLGPWPKIRSFLYFLPQDVLWSFLPNDYGLHARDDTGKLHYEFKIKNNDQFTAITTKNGDLYAGSIVNPAVSRIPLQSYLTTKYL